MPDLPVPGLAWDSRQGTVRRHNGDGCAREDTYGGTDVAPDVERSLRDRRGRGAALPESLAGAAGAHLRTDLSGVQVHTDDRADAMARGMGAKAFTHGSDLYFTKGSYRPESAEGQHLIAHELAHVAQQNARMFSGPATGSGTTIGRADDPAESHAERVARDLVPALRRQAALVGQEKGI